MDMLLGIYCIPGAIFWHMVFYDKNSKVPEWIQRIVNKIINIEEPINPVSSANTA